MDSTLFYLLLFAHWISLIVAFGSVLLIDFYGLLWMIRKETLCRVFKVADIAQKLVWLGWGGLIVTGIPLLVIKAFVDHLTWLKIFLVLLVGLNGLYLDSIKKAGEKLPETGKTPFWLIYRMGLSTVISQVGWWGTIVIGFLHRNIDHVIQWPKSPGMVMAGVAAVFGAAFLIGVFIFKKKAPAAG
jgi:hypothetical protein